MLAQRTKENWICDVFSCGLVLALHHNVFFFFKARMDSAKISVNLSIDGSTQTPGQRVDYHTTCLVDGSDRGQKSVSIFLDL